VAQQRPSPSDRSAEHAARLLDLVYDAIFTRSFRDRVILYWNRGAEEIYGYPAEAAVGRVPGELLQTRYPQPLDEIEWELLATGRWEGELVQIDSRGREIVVAGRWALNRDADGEPIEILEVNRDVTEAKLADRELRENEERFRLLVENVRDYAIFGLDPRGCVASWNEGARRIKGYEAREILGRHFSVFYTPEDVVAGRPGQALAIATREGSYQVEGERVRKDGSRFWADVVITALRDERGLLRGFAKVTRDITERRSQQQRELEVERSHARHFREHAERAQDLERTKSNFLNLVSHELRTPLGILRGYLSMFEDGSLGTLPPRAVETLPALQRTVIQMTTLVEELLQLARIEDRRLQLRRRQVDLARLVAETAGRVGLVYPERNVVLSLPAAPVMTEIDPGRISLVFDNLIRNAIKYSPDGGDVDVEVATLPDRAQVRVRDRGIGIESEHMERLFTRFGRIETPQTEEIPGTGLGLYLSRELVRLHGGEIMVESIPGKGSVFTVTLPLAAVSGGGLLPPGA
jgi:PAS domain S-box-containing protein